MLVDIKKYNYFLDEDDVFLNMFDKVNRKRKIKTVKNGIYITNMFNYFGNLDRLTMDLTNKNNKLEFGIGTCDNYKQAEKYFNSLELKEEKEYFINLQLITKKDYPNFRWHKCGEYIGNQNPEYEHLGDEKHIEKVYAFTIFEIKEN